MFYSTAMPLNPDSEHRHCRFSPVVSSCVDSFSDEEEEEEEEQDALGAGILTLLAACKQEHVGRVFMCLLFIQSSSMNTKCVCCLTVSSLSASCLQPAYCTDRLTGFIQKPVFYHPALSAAKVFTELKVWWTR